MLKLILLVSHSFLDAQAWQPVWDDCKKDSDCVVAEQTCGEPWAIHKKFKKENDHRNEVNRPLSSCLENNGLNPEAYKAACVARKCALRNK